MSETAEVVFGARLRALRRSQGVTQAELAGEMRRAGFNWHQTTVAKTEAAQRPVRVNEANHAAAIFGVSLIELMVDA